jgi:L-malate glycosyltransferase
MPEKQKKICLATPEFPPEQWGGLARTVGNISLHARDMGLDVHVAHFCVNATSPVFLDENRDTRRADGITVHRITLGKENLQEPCRELWDCPHTLTLQMMYQSLEMLYGKEGFDLFHSFFLYPVGYVTGLLARRAGVPSLVTLVGNDIKKYLFSPEKVAVCRSGLENADRVVALSRDLAEMAHSLTAVESKSRIIYNSVKIPSRQWSADKDQIGPLRIGSAGIFKYAKGLPYLFKAVAEVARKRSVMLELRGVLRDSETAVYDFAVSGTGIEKIVRLLPPLPHDQVSEWLRGLDVFVLPSLTEGCPNILMEAMASGVPSVATRTGAADFLMEDRVSGLLVPWGDSTALGRAIGEILDDRSLAESLGAAAREKMGHFSSERERSAWENVYRELIPF